MTDFNTPPEGARVVISGMKPVEKQKRLKWRDILLCLILLALVGIGINIRLIEEDLRVIAVELPSARP